MLHCTICSRGDALKATLVAGQPGLQTMRRDVPAASADPHHLSIPQIVVADELTARAGADQDGRAVAVAGLLQLRGDVHRGPDDGVIHARRRSHGAREDSAGINANTDADDGMTGRALAMVPGDDLPHHASSAFCRPVSIVGARCRNSECRHQAIAEELVHRSSIAVDASDHEDQKLIEKAQGVGRSKVFDQLRKANHIHEEDCRRQAADARGDPPGGAQIENQLGVDKARQVGAALTQVHHRRGLAEGASARFERPGIGDVIRHRAIPKQAISGERKLGPARRRRSRCKVHAFRISLLP